MGTKYNQFRAMMAVTKASLKATFRSPQSIFFSLFFPVVLIWIFGSLGGNGTPTVDVALAKGSDTTSYVYQSLRHNPILRFEDDPKKDIEDELTKGRITAVLDVQRAHDSAAKAPYEIHLRTSSAAQKDIGLLYSVLNATVNKMDSAAF